MQCDEQTEKTGAVGRTMAVLEALSRYEAINLETLAKEAAMPKATLLRFLSCLVGAGYVYRDESDRYSLTLKMLSVGSRALEHIDVRRVITPIAHRLSETLKETVHVGILSLPQAVYVLKIESKHTIRMHSHVGKTIPLYCTAIGKALLSCMAQDEYEKAIASVDFVPYTGRTVKNEAELRCELEKVRQNGWAIDNGEHEEGIVCIAVPVFDYTKGAAAAISVSWPQFRFEQAKQSEYCRHIMSAARQASTLLGYV